MTKSISERTKSRLKQSVIILSVGVAVNVALAIVKMYVGLSSNSLTIMLDGTNNLFDVITTVITLIAVAVLFIPRSENAVFGYGRSEYLAGFIVAVVSAVVSGMFFIQSLNRLAMPEPIWFGWQNCVLISCTVPVKIGLGLFYHLKNKKLKSKAIAAIAMDSFLDVGITSASVVAFSISSQIDYAADAIFGIIISVLVLAFAIKMIIDSVKSVVKGDGAEEELETVKSHLKSDARIGKIGNVILHDYGYGAKVGTAEVAFKDGVSLDDVKIAEEEFHDRVLEECGAEVWLVPLDNARLKSELHSNKFQREENGSDSDKRDRRKK